MKIYLSIALTTISLSAFAQEPAARPSTIKLVIPTKAPEGIIKTPVGPDYFADFNSIKLHQADSHIISYDMITNLDEGTNSLSNDPSIYSHSMRSNYLLNCKSGEDSRNGIEVFSEFFGKGQSITKIPESLEWRSAPKHSMKTWLSKNVCMRMSQNHIKQTPDEIKAEFETMLEQ